MIEPKTEPKVEPKVEPKATHESREAIMGCGCRLIMDAATFDAEGAHCEVHDNTEVVRVIKIAPVELPDLPEEPEPEVATEPNHRRRRGR